MVTVKVRRAWFEVSAFINGEWIRLGLFPTAVAAHKAMMEQFLDIARTTTMTIKAINL